MILGMMKGRGVFEWVGEVDDGVSWVGNMNGEVIVYVFVGMVILDGG